MNLIRSARSRWRVLLVGFFVVLIVALGLSKFWFTSQVSSAANLGEVDVGTLGVGRGSIVQCSDDNISLDQIRTGYSGGAYRVVSVRFASVPSSCEGLAYSLAVLDNSSGHTSLAEKLGTVPAAGNTVTFSGNTGPNLNSINVANDEIRLALAVYHQ